MSIQSNEKEDINLVGNVETKVPWVNFIFSPLVMTVGKG